jgi:LuxR family glucitol operon transcriptional activator
MRWCIDQERYEDVVQFWFNVRDFTHIYGFWSDRLSLLDWLIVEADNRRDHVTSIQLMYDKAFTLTLTGPSTRLVEAESLLQRCWSLREYAPLSLQARVTALTASLYIKHRKHDEAHEWLDTGEQLLRSAELEPVEYARERASMLFDRGENWFVAGDYARAQIVFKEMLEQAEISGWQRTILHAQNWLTYTSLLHGKTDVSNEYLQSGWSIASRIKERRLTAYFQRTYAYYYHEIEEFDNALRWAEDALDSFERLGMPPDIDEMHNLIGRLKAN